jgi:RNA polymerase sigma-70 factor (ECF subfamily)
VTQEQEASLKAVMTVAHHNFEKGLNVRAFFKVGDRQLGEDLVQDTFLKTWKYLMQGGKVEVMKAFLYHVLNHLIIDEYRKHKTSSLDILLEKGFEPRADSGHGGDGGSGGHSNEEGKLMDMLDGKAAILMIARLPVKYQKVMRMRYVQDLSLTEMSLITGKTKNTMAVQVHRGLEKLKLLYREV